MTETLGVRSYDKSVLGRPLTWDEAAAHLGKLVWYRREYQSHTCYQVVRVENYLPNYKQYFIKGNRDYSDRLVLYTGATKPITADEVFNKHNFFELKEKGADKEP